MVLVYLLLVDILNNKGLLVNNHATVIKVVYRRKWGAADEAIVPIYVFMVYIINPFSHIGISHLIKPNFGTIRAFRFIFRLIRLLSGSITILGKKFPKLALSIIILKIKGLFFAIFSRKK